VGAMNQIERHEKEGCVSRTRSISMSIKLESEHNRKNGGLIPKIGFPNQVFYLLCQLNTIFVFEMILNILIKY